MSSYKKIKSTIMVPEDTYKETRILAIRKGMDIGSLVDEALREKIVRDYQQMGLQPPFPQQKILQIDICLPGIEFPTDKPKIIKHAEEANTPKVFNFLKSISDRRYKNKSDLENELLNDIKSSKADFIKEGGSVIFKIHDEKLSREQYEEKKLEQGNKIRIVK